MGEYRAYQLGVAGEQIAERYLAATGLRIVARRFRCRGGELDLVCEQESGTRGQSGIVFVEVKTRTCRGFGRPEAAVSARKRGRLLEAAKAYLYEHPDPRANIRFDVVSVWIRQSRGPLIEHFVDAFGVHELMDRDPWY